MSKSLQEQLLQAGLIDKKRAKQLTQSKRKQPKPKGKSRPVAQPPLAQKAQAEKAAKDRALNKRRQEAAEAKSRAAQIIQLMEANRLDRRGGETAFQFVAKGKIKKIYVTEAQHTELVNGTTALVRFGGRSEIVPIAIAEKIRERSANAVVVLSNVDTPNSDDNDPYADYQVPDDLMW